MKILEVANKVYQQIEADKVGLPVECFIDKQSVKLLCKAVIEIKKDLDDSLEVINKMKAFIVKVESCNIN